MAIESVNQCSVLCIKSEMQSNDGLFKEYVYWRSNMSFKKVNEKIVLLQLKDLIHIVSSYIGLKKNLCTFLMSTSHPFERDITRYCHWAPSIV